MAVRNERNTERKTLPKKYVGLISLLLTVLMLAASYFVCVLSLIPVRYDVVAGDIAPDTVYASETVIDEALTLALRDNARRNTQPVYTDGSAAQAQLLAQAAAYFTSLGEVRSLAQEYSFDTATLSEEQLSTLRTLPDPDLTAEQLTAVISAGTAEIESLRRVCTSELTTALTSLTADRVDEMLTACKATLAVTNGISQPLKALGNAVFDRCVEATCTIDDAATLTAQEEAADAVPDATIAKGELIVSEGDKLTAGHISMLRELGFVREPSSDTRIYAGLAVVLIAAFAVLFIWLYVYCKDTFASLKSMLIISVTVTVTLLLILLCNTVEPHISPALMAIMLTALLTSYTPAFGVTFVLAVVSALTSGGRSAGLMGFESLAMTVCVMISGMVTIFALKRSQHRGALIAAGAGGSLAGAIVMMLMYVMKEYPAKELLIDALWFFGGGVFSTLITVGSMTLWENLFDVATAARLNELSNISNPLLRQLMTEAPGTYHHSVMTAALAEGAALAVDADPLLARVGAYYHDVGKLRRPLYFAENQKPGENIHDKLPPEESAQIIISHQKDSVSILTKSKLPSAVVKIAAEHHGNSLMSYFLYKAQQNSDQPVNKKLFRYTGARPSTKEGAIVMLADSCEAAVRSLGDGATREQVEEMVHKVIYGKMSDKENLLSNAPLTLSQITDIEKSFLSTFNGILHDRIEYPGQEKRK